MESVLHQVNLNRHTRPGWETIETLLTDLALADALICELKQDGYFVTVTSNTFADGTPYRYIKGGKAVRHG